MWLLRYLGWFDWELEFPWELVLDVDEVAVWKVAGLVTNSIFSVSFFKKKSLICLEGKSMTPLVREIISIHLFCSYKQLPYLLLGSLKGAVSAQKVVDRGPRLSWCVASGTTEKQGHHQVCTRVSTRRCLGPRTALKTADANLCCALVYFFCFTLPLHSIQRSGGAPGSSGSL